ncbi:Disks large-associated protein 3 [Bienertia sinuspersici]
MANSNMKVLIFAASLIAMAIIVSAHDGHDHADGPSSKMVIVSAHEGHDHAEGPSSAKDGRDGETGGSSSIAPVSGLMVGLVGLVFSFARI